MKKLVIALCAAGLVACTTQRTAEIVDIRELVSETNLQGGYTQKDDYHRNTNDSSAYESSVGDENTYYETTSEREEFVDQNQARHTSHIVRAGETLLSISRQKGIPLSAIKAVNPNINFDRLSIGQRINLPTSNVVSRPQYEEATTQGITQSGVYVVQPKDGLYAIARKLNISVADLKRLNPNIDYEHLNIGQRLNVPGKRRVSMEVEQEEPQQRITTSVKSYRVRRGDTLYAIARKLNVPVALLKQSNSNINIDRLRPGQVLKVPTQSNVSIEKTEVKEKVVQVAKTYRVRRGDTFYAIARKLGVSSKALKQANKGVSISRLKAGQVLKVPGQYMTKKVENEQTVVQENTVQTVEQSNTPAENTYALKSRTVNGVKWSKPMLSGRLGAFHKNELGVSVKTAQGASVLSAADGTVTHVQPVKGMGQVVIIRHAEGFVSVYASPELKTSVFPRQQVKRGQKIANIPGDVDTFHFQIRHKTEVVNPNIYVPE
ncbi:MAG: LysM peptidoglycan-binding domain-containing protein [Alcaligenaceae bacterium]|nr:LysM peptidoglycan-binding domain-containing protein [Alcaligenaceae bacterium]